MLDIIITTVTVMQIWKYMGLWEHPAWRPKLSQNMKECFLEKSGLKYETRGL